MSFLQKAGHAVCLMKLNSTFLSEFLKWTLVSLIKKGTKEGEGVSILNSRGVFTVKDHKQFSHDRNPLDAFITIESELFLSFHFSHRTSLLFPPRLKRYLKHKCGWGV